MGKSWIVENKWTCSSCSTGNLGRHMECQNCGSPKEKHEKYDTSGATTAPAVTDKKMLTQARAGANWTCKYCSNDNRDLYDECEECGADRYAGRRHKVYRAGRTRAQVLEERKLKAPTKEDWAELDRTTAEGLGLSEPEPRRTFTGGGYRTPPKVVMEEDEPLEEPDPSDYVAAPLQPSLWRRLSRWRPTRTQKIVGASVAGVAALASILLWVFLPRMVEARVDSTTWQYTRQLQQRQMNHGTDWDGNMPAGAFNVSCVTRQRGTENCNPHDCNCRSVTDYCSETCNCRTVCSDNGNGYSTCSEQCSTCRVACGSHQECSTCYDQCPVYDEWCEFDYYTWPTIDREVTHGRGHAVEWGERLVINREAPHPQRIVQSEHYEVVFVEDEDSWDIEPESLSEYRRYAEGEMWLIKVNRAGQVWPQHEVGDEG
jgi:hypothetical protein